MSERTKEAIIWAIVLILFTVGIALASRNNSEAPCHYDTHGNCN